MSRLFCAMESLADGVVVYDNHQRFVACNGAYRALYPKIDDLLYPGVAYERQLRAGLARGQFLHGKRGPGLWLKRKSLALVNGGRCLIKTGDGRCVEAQFGTTPDGDYTAVHRDVTEFRGQLEAARRSAETDALTGLLNRRGFFHNAANLLRRLNASDLVATLLMDLDRFKQLNDRLGHMAGDAILSAVGDRLAIAAPKGAVIGRLGGDEFAIVACRSRNSDAAAMAEEIVGMIRPPIAWRHSALAIRCSVGVHVAEAKTADLDGWLAAADRALYAAKAQGGNRWLLGASVEDAARGRADAMDFRRPADTTLGEPTGVDTAQAPHIDCQQRRSNTRRLPQLAQIA